MYMCRYSYVFAVLIFMKSSGVLARSQLILILSIKILQVLNIQIVIVSTTCNIVCIVGTAATTLFGGEYSLYR